jgi:small subunit ribosomal protein S4
MGKPKFSRKKYETPSHPWQEDRINAENELVKKYGLKNKREVWKAQTHLRKYRGQARELLARVSGGDVQSKKESDQLLMYLNRMNILPPNSTLDDVLALETESILSRRLQTLIYLKGLANTPDQSRQLITHGHIAIGDRRVTVPGYMVEKDEEGDIGYTKDSPLNDIMHPARPRADFKSIPIGRELKTKETKDIKGEKPTEGQPKVEKPAQPAKEEKKEIPSKPKQEEVRPKDSPPQDDKKIIEEKKPEVEKPISEDSQLKKEEKPLVETSKPPDDKEEKKEPQKIEDKKTDETKKNIDIEKNNKKKSDKEGED